MGRWKVERKLGAGKRLTVIGKIPPGLPSPRLLEDTES